MTFRPKLTWVVAVLLAAGMAYYYFVLLIPHVRVVHALHHLDGGYYYGGDLYPIWLTTHEVIVHHRNPYTDAMTHEIQVGLFGRSLEPHQPGDPPPHYRAFSYPLYTDVLGMPFTWLSFPGVQWLLAFISPFLVGASVWFWIRAFDLRLETSTAAIVVLLTLATYSVLEALFAQQPAIIVVVALSLMSACLARGRFLLAGAFLALGGIKPQLTLLLTLWLLLWAASGWRERKHFIFGFALTLALLLGASQLILPGWINDWHAALVEYRQYTEPPLAQWVLGKWLGGFLELALLCVCAAACWRTRNSDAMSRDFSLSLSLVLAVTIVTLPTGGAVYDHMLLLPTIFWLYAQEEEVLRAGRMLRLFVVLAGVALAWQWIAACIVSVLTWFVPSLRHSAQLLVLPLRTAAPFPFALLAVLTYFAVRLLLRRMPASEKEIPAMAA